MKPKSSAHYQREYRKRLRELGLVKKEVWVLPEHARQLALYEQELRHSATLKIRDLLQHNGEKTMTKTDLDTGIDMSTPWTTMSLFQALSTRDLFVAGRAHLELIDGVSPALHVVMNDFGDLPIFITVSGEQILVESLLWSITEVKDAALFNEAILRTHKYFPLSTISLDKIDGEDFYHMFGALSSLSSLKNIVFEIEILASNVIQAAQAYSDFLLEQID